jgi:hypothetical protein
MKFLFTLCHKLLIIVTFLDLTFKNRASYI